MVFKPIISTSNIFLFKMHQSSLRSAFVVGLHDIMHVIVMHLVSKDGSVINRKSAVFMEQHLIHRAVDRWQATQFTLRMNRMR